ncbi:unnamed protein product [Periconia digitata]|uniref:Ferric oxidoreductase domain-containing protein n=1 Tax=Periconia digitata TaxID=1303443 RepID=A0A9W4XZG1_9PLEO|nr:unnamed protein product [Periconia digitata]
MKLLDKIFFTSITLTSVSQARTERGFIGYGIDPSQPYCAQACRDAISSATLDCSTMEDMGHMSDMMHMVTTSADCYATDDAYLQTLAWCISERCREEKSWKLEKWWSLNTVGTEDIQPDPKVTYQGALSKVDGTPAVVYAETGSLNTTSVVGDGLWIPAYTTNSGWISQEKQQVKFGLVILLSGVIIPVGFSFLRFFPIPHMWRSKFSAWVVEPPLWGTRHDTPIFFGLFQMPKRGQGLFIFYMIAINVVFSGVNYLWVPENTWYGADKARWMAMLVTNRLGLLSYANLPLIFLYAGRNNFLLWITNWSHSTFLLLHKWIAAIATLEAILHSIIYLHIYVKAGTHNAEAKEPYWYWGIIATLAMTILFPSSLLPLRKKAYELFLAWHVIISILVVAGCYWHVVFRFSHKWGYETWVIMSMAIWAFDRIFRFLRLARNGIKRADVTVIDDEYARVTIPDVSASGHVYLYFPTLTWRVWENHPFSIASTSLPSPISSSGQSNPSSSQTDIEKQSPVFNYPIEEQNRSPTRSSSAESRQSGLTFFIRTHSGLTSLITTRRSFPVLVEAGYSSHSLASVHKAPTLVAIAGGVGVTSVVPYLRGHPGRAKLYWGCRTQGLVDNVRSTGCLDGVEQRVVVGERLDIRRILDEELVHGGTSRVCVFVSGPVGMTDEVRILVGEIVRKGCGVDVDLVVESFSW